MNFDRLFHSVHHPFWGIKSPIFGSTPISSFSWLLHARPSGTYSRSSEYSAHLHIWKISSHWDLNTKLGRMTGCCLLQGLPMKWISAHQLLQLQGDFLTMLRVLLVVHRKLNPLCFFLHQWIGSYISALGHVTQWWAGNSRAPSSSPFIARKRPIFIRWRGHVGQHQPQVEYILQTCVYIYYIIINIHYITKKHLSNDRILSVIL